MSSLHRAIRAALAGPVIGVVLLATAGAAAADGATGAPPGVSAGEPNARAVVAGTVLDNLRWTAMRTMSGSVTWMLRVQSDPRVEPGGVYFLWNPEASSSGGAFAVGDDVRVSTVRHWKAAIFPPTSSADRIEVRYGDPAVPEGAEVVASIARCPRHVMC